MLNAINAASYLSTNCLATPKAFPQQSVSDATLILLRRKLLQQCRWRASRILSDPTRASAAQSTLSSKAVADEKVTAALVAAPATRFRKPHVLAPAGGWPQLKAAVENGADAVYLGLSAFNARARAINFSPDELPEVMGYLHERGVKGYVTMNILLFDEELERAEETIRVIAASNADAVIVQDIGVVELVRRVAPSLPIHASTQMSITSADGADFARQLGARRVVVGRELSIADISKVAAGTEAEVEAFVHGALCVSYSGQCFSSEAWGGRSANRGQCAQACRMPYGLVVNGQLRELGDIKYLLSPQDLMALERIPDLIKAGVSCFKIEGRLKGPEYVAVTTAAYRWAVDSAWADLASEPDVSASIPLSIPEEQRNSLHQVFARGQDEEHRGLTPGFLEGPQHQRLVRGQAPRHRGALAGRVLCVDAQRSVVTIDMMETLKRGDGLVFDSGAPDGDEEGGTIYNVDQSKQRSARSGSCVDLKFGPGQLNLRRVKAGDLVWRNKDPALEAQARASYKGLSSSAMRKVPVAAALKGSIGQALELELSIDGVVLARAESAVHLQPATSNPLGETAVQAALGQLGDNSLALTHLDLSGLNLTEGLFIPLSELKALRRSAANRCLRALRQRPSSQGLQQAAVLPGMLRHLDDDSKEDVSLSSRSPSAGSSGSSRQLALGAVPQRARTSSARQEDVSRSASCSSGPQQQQQQALLRVLCRSMAQVQAARQIEWLRDVILDFLEVHGLKEAVALVKQSGKTCTVCTPRVLKPGEERLAAFYLRLQPDALLVRSAGMLHSLNLMKAQGALSFDKHAEVPELEGDFSLNAANTLSASLLLQKGLQRLAPTHDLNAAQLAALGRLLGPHRASKLEAIVHQHLPIFHTEHCVFCRSLSDGNSYLDCGRPCESNSVHLRDGNGKDHLVLADEGCRNTVFNAQAQSGLWHLKQLQAAGYGSFRLELVDEPAEQVRPILEAYRDVMSGERSPGAVWRWLGSLASRWGAVEGVTAGSLEVKTERPAAVLKPTAAAGR